MPLRHVQARGKSKPARRPFCLRVAFVCGPLYVAQKKGFATALRRSSHAWKCQTCFANGEGGFVSPLEHAPREGKLREVHEDHSRRLLWRARPKALPRNASDMSEKILWMCLYQNDSHLSE